MIGRNAPDTGGKRIAKGAGKLMVVLNFPAEESPREYDCTVTGNSASRK